MSDTDLCGRTLGEFVVREQIAERRNSAVYRGFQPSLKRDVVIKVLREPQPSNSAAKERFLREAQLASRLHHSYVAHVYAFGVEDEDGLCWIAMELVQGITLDNWLSKRGPIPLDQFVPYFEHVAEVIQAMHEHGIIHRDLKPSNLMVIEHGDRKTPMLLDFGIAKEDLEVAPPTPENCPEDPLGEDHMPVDARRADGVTNTDPKASDWHLTPSGVAIGSWAYMSPEQWDNARTVGPASDIYSLGVLAYQALTGRLPFPGESVRQCYWEHLHTKVPPLGGDLSSKLDPVFQRALAKPPEARHSNAMELAEELRAVLQASERELLRSLAQQWNACARTPGLLLAGDVLASVERWTRHAPSGVLSKL